MRLTELYYTRIKVFTWIPVGQPVLDTITTQPNRTTKLEKKKKKVRREGEGGERHREREGRRGRERERYE